MGKIKLSDLLQKAKSNEDEANKIIKQAIKWYRTSDERANYVRPPSEGKMPILTEAELSEIDLPAKLQEYASWCGHYNYQTCKWRSIYGYLRDLHEGLYSEQCAATTGGVERARLRAKANLSVLFRATTIAKNKFESFEGNYRQANKQHEMVSRFITYLGIESSNYGNRRGFS